MSNSKCVKSIKALKHYKHYRSAMIASILAISGTVFLGGTAEAAPKRVASSAAGSSGSSSGQGVSGRVNQTLINSGSGRSPGLSPTKVLGSQDIQGFGGSVPVQISNLMDDMKQQSDNVSSQKHPDGIMYFDVPKWSWAKEYLEHGFHTGKLLYYEKGDDSYNIFIWND